MEVEYRQRLAFGVVASVSDGTGSLGPERTSGLKEQSPDSESVAIRTEEEATAVAWKALDEVGGPRMIYRNPRMAYSFASKRTVQVEGHDVEVRYGEIASPAILTVAGWVFEIGDEDITLLMRPRSARP